MRNSFSRFRLDGARQPYNLKLTSLERGVINEEKRLAQMPKMYRGIYKNVMIGTEDQKERQEND